jgi:hypothetical protein
VARLNVRQSTALAWISSYSVERKDALFQDFYKENRLLADTVRAQIAGGRAQPADAVTPKQEAAQLAEQQDDLFANVRRPERPSSAGLALPPMTNLWAACLNGPSKPLVTPISCNITRIGSVCADDPRSASQDP